MTTFYPGSVDTFTTKTDGVDYNLASHINDLQDSVVAVENELGIDPAGSYATVKERLDVMGIVVGKTAWIPSFENLTIGNGNLTAYYEVVNNKVSGVITIAFGSTTVISGDVFVLLPSVGNALSSWGTPMGEAIFVDAGTAYYLGVVFLLSSTKLSIGVRNSSGVYVSINALSPTVPMTWTTNDRLSIDFTYFI